MPVCGSGAVVTSWSPLIRKHQRARCQAEIPLIALCKIPEPLLDIDAVTVAGIDLAGVGDATCESRFTDGDAGAVCGDRAGNAVGNAARENGSVKDDPAA